MEMFLKKKEALKNYLQTNKQRVSLTTDIWVSQVTGKFFSFLNTENNLIFIYTNSIVLKKKLQVQVTWL